MSRSSRVVRVARVVFVGFLVALLVKWAPLDFSVARKGTAPAALQAGIRNRPELSGSFWVSVLVRFGRFWSVVTRHNVMTSYVSWSGIVINALIEI